MSDALLLVKPYRLNDLFLDFLHTKFYNGHQHVSFYNNIMVIFLDWSYFQAYLITIEWVDSLPTARFYLRKVLGLYTFCKKIYGKGSSYNFEMLLINCCQ